jgi:hypothetical protein
MATRAEEVAKKGEEALDKASREQIAQARAMVDQQAAALKEVEKAARKLDSGEKLSMPDRRVLQTVAGLTAEEVQTIHEAESDPERLERFLRTPEAFFYVRGDDDSMLKVVIKHGEKITFIPDTDENYE